jgi:hypothetical protein
MVCAEDPREHNQFQTFPVVQQSNQSINYIFNGPRSKTIVTNCTRLQQGIVPLSFTSGVRGF